VRGWGSHMFRHGGKVVYPTRRPLFILKKIHSTYFC
jgi:hypothetical protein